MDDLKKLFVQTTKYAVILGILCVCFAFVFFGMPSAIGICVGVVTGQLGLVMIIRFARTIGSQAKANRSGLKQYVLRYFMYGIIMVIFAYIGVPVLSVLIGFMCTKGAILMYSQKLRKEADDVSS
ncbi:hypothetical protein C815_00124 [Firmicutes bacterium M10-2]|nr:hypothetical protein C815_00124 [Firmicutes bacterium M10-2]